MINKNTGWHIGHPVSVYAIDVLINCYYLIVTFTALLIALVVSQ